MPRSNNATKPLRERVRDMYDWFDRSSEVHRKKRGTLTPRLVLRLRVVMHAFHWTMRVYDEIPGELPVTILPWRHIDTLRELVSARPAHFLQNGVRASPGETHFVYYMCVHDAAIRTTSGNS